MLGLPNSIDELLKATVELGGTDLHISVGARPRARIVGKLVDLNYGIVKPADAERLLLSLIDMKDRTDLNTYGQHDLSYQVMGLARFRVNIFRQKGDYAAVFRVLNETIPDYTKLGLPVSVFNLYKKRRGLVLIVGPTGSGKSTTLASFLNIINKNTQKHIITLEDPIEYVHWHSKSLVNQREIGVDCDSFASGLRAALREDPDVILIGEMRDFETTEIALQSAETGHLVCSTLHTLGASETINRVIAMYPEKEQRLARSQLTSILEAVVSQQLLPKADGTGYVVAFEVMFKTPQIKKYIQENNLDAITEFLKTKEAEKEGMFSMDNKIFNLYKRGTITKDTALDYAFDRRDMYSRIQQYNKEE